MKTIQLTINNLQSIIDEAKKMKLLNSDLSNTIEITIQKSTDLNSGSDIGYACIRSSYGECESKFITDFK